MTYSEFKSALKDYGIRAHNDLIDKQTKTWQIMRQLKLPLWKSEDRQDAAHRLQLVLTASSGEPDVGYEIAKRIVKDFPRQKKLRVFAYGAGYGELLYFLKNHRGAEVSGVDLSNFSMRLTNEEGLNVIHGVSVADHSLRQHKAYDVTYSRFVFERPIISREEALAMLDNMAHMTKRGGKSYHVLMNKEPLVTKKEIMARGFRINEWRALKKGYFIKLTKL